MLSKKCKYAIHALVHMAKEPEEKFLIKDISEACNIPKKFLEGILLSLRNHGLLQSRKGQGGGYLLGRDPSKIMLGQIVRLFDGPLAPVPCASQTAYVPCDDCQDEASCGVRLAMREVRDATAKILDNTSLASLQRKCRRAATPPV